MRILLADTETTDVDESAEICELAFIEVDENLNEVHRFSSLVKPQGLISPAASGSSGITNKVVEDAPRIEAVIAELQGTLGADYFQNVFLIAHNLKFDRRLLQPYWQIPNGLCTLRAAMHWLPDSPNHKLQTLRHYLDIDMDAKAHSALDDVLVMKAVLETMIARSKLGSFQKFAEGEASFRRIMVMPWGKHNGVALSALPSGYVRWLFGLPNLDEELRWSLEHRFDREVL